MVWVETRGIQGFDDENMAGVRPWARGPSTGVTRVSGCGEDVTHVLLTPLKTMTELRR